MNLRMTMQYEIGGCPACGSTAATEIADGAALRDELEQLWAFHTARLRGDTPPERLHDRIAFSQDPPLRIARCSGCSLLYRNPRERAERLVDLYAGERADPGALRSLFENQRRSYRAQARRLTRLLGRTGTGLEVGSYVGAFLAAAREHGWSFTGVDVNPEANAFAAAEGFDVVRGSIEESTAGTGYDVVAFWNCFDQLPDPRAAVRAARERVRDDGIIALRVPNGDFYARWRSRLRTYLRPVARALLAHNNLLGFPYRHGFTPASLERLLGAAGFRVAAIEGDVLVPLADEWTRRWAVMEERLLKEAMRLGRDGSAPWIEVYARAT
jgi:SAM-dependent methyltransferase